MIRFICPVCRAALKAHDDKAGKPVRCPKCRHTGIVPIPAPAGTPPALRESDPNLPETEVVPPFDQ